MSIVSVTGKNWVFRTYENKKIKFFKNNFFLDEITAKLLSIRNIKIEDIQNF